MKHKITTILLAGAAVTALAIPTGAQARHGADDPPGHVRHSRADDSFHGRKHRQRSRVSTSRSSTSRVDDRGRGRGTDDGPNHT